jgi:ABC-type uncharacterized transport system substrate-binding protein
VNGGAPTPRSVNAEALFIEPDGFVASRRVQIVTLAMRDRMPATYASREMVQAGLLMSYGSNIGEMFRQWAFYTGTILRGAQPADLAVIQATKFEFVINLQTARSLGLGRFTGPLGTPRGHRIVRCAAPRYVADMPRGLV